MTRKKKESVHKIYRKGKHWKQNMKKREKQKEFKTIIQKKQKD
jgi:hypothetical protein